MSNGPTIYVNGKFLLAEDAAISPLDRGFALGDGLFETIRVENGRPFRLGAHLQRLRSGLTTIEMALPHEDGEFKAAIQELLSRNRLTRASVRITVGRGVPEARGLLPGRILSGPTIVIQAMPYSGYPAEKYETGFSAIVATIRRNETSPSAYVKSCNYLDNILVRMAAAAAEADEGIMMNMAGNLACGSVSNIFVVKEGRLRTPPITAGILAGIARATVIEIAMRERIGCLEEDLTTDDLWAADEAFLTNSLMGAMPLTRVDSKSIGNGQPGVLTGQVGRAFEDLVKREAGSVQ
jgi:D-amino acid aminotransferase